MGTGSSRTHPAETMINNPERSIRRLMQVLQIPRDEAIELVFDPFIGTFTVNEVIQQELQNLERDGSIPPLRTLNIDGSDNVLVKQPSGNTEVGVSSPKLARILEDQLRGGSGI